MEFFEYDDNLDGRINLYKSNFFHIYLEGESLINNDNRFNRISTRDYGSFVHEYIHYIQQITTPYGIKYNSYFNNNLILYRELVNSKEVINLPLELEEVIEPAKLMELELKEKNGSKYFSKGNIDDIEISDLDIQSAKEKNAAVNIGIYDFENNKAFVDGFQFGYWCVIESMAHLVQSLVNPELFHSKVPYESAQLICNKIRPDLQHDTKLLISICYVALYFNNPGLAFFDILKSADADENGLKLYQRYMTDYSRNFMGREMPNYRMMHIMLDDFAFKLGALVGNELDYYKGVFERCKYESSRGNSLFLSVLYEGNFSNIQDFSTVLNFYGYPAIDSKSNDIVVPFNEETNEPYLETASLISLELLIHRFEQKNNEKLCVRFPICDKHFREADTIEEACKESQWEKTKPCLFRNGLLYWGWENKTFRH